PFARQSDPRRILDTCRDVNRQGSFARDPPAACADLAGLLNYLTAALAGHAGAFDREEALACADFAKALAGRACDGARSRFRSSTAASITCDRSRNANLRGLSVEGLRER